MLIKSPRIRKVVTAPAVIKEGVASYRLALVLMEEFKDRDFAGSEVDSLLTTLCEESRGRYCEVAKGEYVLRFRLSASKGRADTRHYFRTSKGFAHEVVSTEVESVDDI